MQLTLEQIFGIGTTQDANTLIIQKSSLFGLNSQFDNKATVLLAAIVNTAHQQFEGVLTDENNNEVTDENNFVITYDDSNVWEQITLNYWGKTFPTKFVRLIFLFRQSQPYIAS